MQSREQGGDTSRNVTVEERKKKSMGGGKKTTGNLHVVFIAVD